MRRTSRHVPVFLTALLLVGIVAAQPSQTRHRQTKSTKQNTLAAVPNPRQAEIHRIQSAEEWPNPYIVVYSDGFELVLGHGGEAIKKARVAEIEEVLLSLPLKRWPLGRVIAVTESGLRNPGETLTKQREEVERMLLEHKVRVERWPSG